jgi:hypothetical protein
MVDEWNVSVEIWRNGSGKKGRTGGGGEESRPIAIWVAFRVKSGLLVRHQPVAVWYSCRIEELEPHEPEKLPFDDKNDMLKYIVYIIV